MRVPMDKLGAKIGQTLSKNAPVIFGVGGILFIGLGVYSAVKETDASAEKRKQIKKGETKPIEYVKILVPSYKKTIIFTTLGISLIGTGIGISNGRLSDALFRESLKEHAITVARRSAYEVVGEEATSRIEEKIGEYYKNAAPEVDETIYKINDTGVGTVLFEDGTMGGIWRSTVYEVKDGFNTANDILSDEEELSFNGFVECFPGRSYIEKGFDIGYSKKKDNKFKIEILPSPDPRSWETGVSEITGEPCYILKYTKPWEYPKFELP